MDKDSYRSRVFGSIKAPTSKSYAQRAVAAALLAPGRSVLRNTELCSDTLAAIEVAGALGAEINRIDNSTYEIIGGLAPRVDTINVGESGLSARMFTPIASLCVQPVTIAGQGSLLTRPMEMMIEPLETLGVKVVSRSGHLPITVQGPIRGGETHVDGSAGSQFITGLLMALPLAEHGTTIHVSMPNSTPYIDMTLDVLQRFGIEIGHCEYEEFFVPGGQSYQPQDYTVEGDWSGASCLLVAGAIAGEVTVRNLNPLSMQADVVLIEALSRAGAEVETTPDSVTVRHRPLNAFVFDATQCPDLFPALVALAANCEGVSSITGTRRLTHKESDRAEVLRAEYAKMGIEVDISEENTMKVTGGRVRDAVVDSHGDHRIAMSVAVAGLCGENKIVVKGAESVAKSYPDFWDDLESVRVKQ